jgi:PAS domain S-box-containing protein
MPGLNNRWWSRGPLFLKITLALVTVIVILVSSVTYLSIRREQQLLRTELEEQAVWLLASLSTAVANPLYTADTKSMSTLLQRLGEDERVIAARVYDKEGRIVADAFDPEIVFNRQIDPLGQDLVAPDTVILQWQADRLLAGQAISIGAERLGAISLGLSTAPLQAKLTDARNQGFGVAVATMVIGLVLTLLLSQSITGPLQGLAQATKKIATSDLTHPVEIAGNDEVAILGTAIEQMRLQLHQLSHQLEQQVAERTQALQESEERFRQVITSITHHVYMTEFTQDGQHLNRYLSPNVEQLTGYPLERFTSDWSFWPTQVIHPDDRAHAAGQVERFLQGLDSNVEYRLVKADGSIIWVHDTGRVVKDQVTGNAIWYGVVNDITERKQAEAALQQSEERYRRLFEDSPISLWEQDFSAVKAYFDQMRSEGVSNFRLYCRQHPEAANHCVNLIKVVDVNQATVRQYKAKTKQELLSSLDQLFGSNPATFDIVREQLLAITEGKTRFAGEGINYTLTGEKLYVSVNWMVAPGYEENYARVLVSVTDITERQQVQEALAQARDEALHASRFKTELLAKVSHELRTPLNVIMGYAEMLKEGVYGPISDKQTETARKIVESTAYLTGLVTELLDQAALEAGKMRLHISDFVLMEVVEETLSNMSVLARAKGLDFKLDVAPDLPTTVTGDPDRIQQIMINLIQNAIKFTAQGSVGVRIYPFNGTHWVLQVSDTGQGIPLEAQAHIFEPFRQVDGSMTRSHSGSGLGLSIARQLITLMGGEITLKSKDGEGSTFTVLFPLTPVQG